MLTIAYAGSFLMMEETSEKTEKTEKSEEALHSIYHGSGFQRTIIKKKSEVNQHSLSRLTAYQTYSIGHADQTDYNVNHLYFSSYLRFHS